jgi:hypothetical protein
MCRRVGARSIWRQLRHLHQESRQKLVRMGSNTSGSGRPKRMRPDGARARYASFRGVRGKRRTIPVNADGYGQSSLSSEPTTTNPNQPDTPLRSEIAMSRMLLTSVFTALLAVGGTQSANAGQGANQSAWTQDSLACAVVGIDPGSTVFSQCVADLHNSLWAVENLYEN